MGCLVFLLVVFLGMQILTLSGVGAISFVFNPMALKFEIGFLGVLGKLENQRLDEKKFQDLQTFEKWRHRFRNAIAGD